MNSVGVEENTFEANVKVYPNPSEAKFVVNLNNVERGSYELKITDMLGKLVFNEILTVNSSIIQNYDISLESGFYFVNISNGNYNTTKKIAIK